jgi:hypothetical protein
MHSITFINMTTDGIGKATSLALALLGFLLITTTLYAESDALIDFSLTDQFGQQHQTADYIGRVVVVIAADKEGSAYNEEWGAAIGEVMAPFVEAGAMHFLPVADLGIVPTFLRGIVMKILPNDTEAMVLLDWDGVFTNAYRLVPNHSNMLVFDSYGSQVLHAHGRELDPHKLEAILQTLYTLLDPAIAN